MKELLVKYADTILSKKEMKSLKDGYVQSRCARFCSGSQGSGWCVQTGSGCSCQGSGRSCSL